MKIKKNTRYLIETKEDLQDFLERCEEKGWRWQSQDSPLDFTPIKIPCIMIYETKSPREGLAWSLTNLYDKIYKRKTPPTLAEFLGWEEGVEYKSRYGTRHKIVDDSLLFYHWQKKQWCTLSGKFNKRHIDILRSHKKYEPKLYYAKIKGWDQISNIYCYWRVEPDSCRLRIIYRKDIGEDITKLTLPEWNALGINESNADFEEVTELSDRGEKGFGSSGKWQDTERGKVMIAKKCDRCGALYEQYNVKNNSRHINGVMFLNIDGNQQYFSHKPSDLCPKCSDELLKWWGQDDDQS